MRSFIHCIIAALCAAGAGAFVYLSFTQSLFNIVFAVTGGCLAKWSFDMYRQRADVAGKSSVACDQEHIESIVSGANQIRRADIIRRQEEMDKFLRRQEAIQRFYRENKQVLSQLEREYRGYIAEEYAREENMPEALSMATDRMMSKYGTEIYPAFRDSIQMLCLSPSMHVANLEAAIKFISTVRIIQ